MKPSRCTNFSSLFLEKNSTYFGQFLCPSSGAFHCTHSNVICHTGLLTACEQDWRTDDHASWYILIIKPNRRTNFSNLFWNKTLHVLDISSVHHQEFFTVHTAMIYVIQVCWQLASRIRMEPILILVASSQQYVYDIYSYCVYSAKLLMMNRGTVRNRVLFQK